jgi:hypothetical protein
MGDNIRAHQASSARCQRFSVRVRSSFVERHVRLWPIADVPKTSRQCLLLRKEDSICSVRALCQYWRGKVTGPASVTIGFCSVLQKLAAKRLEMIMFR